MAGNYRSGGTNERFNSDEYNQSQQPERVRGCKEIVHEAKIKNHWLYDPAAKTWYNPEEFLDKFGRIVSGNEKFLAQVQIRNPADGIHAGFQIIMDAQIKLDNFIRRVLGYNKDKK